MVDPPVTSRRALWPGHVARAGLVLLCLALVGCSGRPEEASTPDSTVLPDSTAATEPTDLGDIVWAGEVDPITSEPVDRRDAFSRADPRVYAVVKTGPLAAGTTLTATWTFNGQPISGTNVVLSADSALTAGWVEFHLEWNGLGLWPIGNLAVEITASSGESVRGTVEIRST